MMTKEKHASTHSVPSAGAGRAVIEKKMQLTSHIVLVPTEILGLCFGSETAMPMHDELPDNLREKKKQRC